MDKEKIKLLGIAIRKGDLETIKKIIDVNRDILFFDNSPIFHKSGTLLIVLNISTYPFNQTTFGVTLHEQVFIHYN